MTTREEMLYELLASKSTEGLSQADSERLENLLIEFPDVQPQEFDFAAAALHLALLGQERPMPAEAKRHLAEAAAAYLGGAPESDHPVAPAETAATPRWGWLAAAAALVLALVGWWPRLQPATDIAATPASVESTEPAPLADDPATLRLAWTATEDATAAGASGEVVWNNERQNGYMRFTGLAVNDPTDFQYQLWIFDRTRDERYPVDGGVFDVTAGGGEVVVPIDARLPVGEPYLFAVTVEPPGGVVVSTRERIALLAQA